MSAAIKDRYLTRNRVKAKNLHRDIALICRSAGRPVPHVNTVRNRVSRIPQACNSALLMRSLYGAGKPRAANDRSKDAILLDKRFNKIYGEDGRKSIPPERLPRALLLQMLYSERSERMLTEQLEYNLLFRWFVGFLPTSQCGIRQCSPRTGVDCWRESLPKNSSRLWSNRPGARNS